MWRIKKWLVLTVMVITMVLLVAVVGGVVYAAASTTSTSPSDPNKTLFTRVAAILGIDQTKLESAFQQAQKEIQSAEMTTRLAAMVAEGKITQTQADQYQQWWQSKPAGIPEMGGMGFRGGLPGGPMPGNQPPSPSTTKTTNSN